MSKEVLLLGGAGFIGLNIAEELVSRGGYKVTIADNFFRAGGKQDSAVEQLAERDEVTIISGDFTDPAAFQNLSTRFDQVYMLASVVGVDYVNSMPHEIIRINTALIYNTLEWIRANPCGKALFTSTSECYAGTIEAFDYAIPTPEEVPLCIQDIGQPRFTYAVTKMLGESGFLNYSKSLGFESSIVRYHNVFGPRMGFKHVVPHLVQRFRSNETPFKIYGHDQTRSFNFISDAVAGTILAMEKGANGEIYHIGSSQEITIDELTRKVGSIMSFDGEYENAPTYPGSVNRRCPDISKAQKELGYEPQVSWEQGIEKTVEWYNAYLDSNPELHESYYDSTSSKKS